MQRVVEPYSLRLESTGNTLLYVHEQTRGGVASQQLKSLDVNEIMSARVLERPFAPKWVVEL